MGKSYKSFILVLLASLSLTVSGQLYELAGGSNAVVRGTSSLHDWKMDLTRMKSGFRLITEGKSVKNLENVQFSCLARDLKSESSLMDKKAYDALRADKFPDITFSGISVTGLNSDGINFNGSLKGNLKVAGEERQVNLPFSGKFSENGSVDVTSSLEISFSEFNMNPPTAMLGTLKTGDRLTLVFNLRYNVKAR